MEWVRLVLLFFHFLGLASLLGGLLVQMKGPSRTVNSAVVHGVLTQLVTGLLLVGVLEASDEPPNRAKIGAKLVVALVIAVLAWVNRRKPAISNQLYAVLMVLTLLNVGLAVFWR
jgi:hypothetical protein